MAAQSVVCPVCGRDDQVEKVSKLYLEGSARRPGESGLGARRSREWAALHRQLAPPVGGRPPFSRPIHPDLVILVFSGILPAFLSGIAGRQRELLFPAIAGLALFYAVYLWQRPRLVARFEAQAAELKTAARRAERAMQRWMRLYYCAGDEVVFEPGRSTTATPDEIQRVFYST